MGTDSSGQLGVKGASPQPLPVQVDKGRWSKVSAGTAYSLALKPDGSLWAFGHNHAAQLGKGNRRNLDIPKRVGGNTWLDMAAGKSVTLAIRLDASLRVWGGWETPRPKGWFRGVLGESRQPAKGRWKAVASGARHGLALKEDGTLWALGDNDLGQAGCEADSLGLNLCQVGHDIWKTMEASETFSVGIREDGSLWIWGQDSLLGLSPLPGSSDRESGMRQVSTDLWLSVAAGTHHILALRSDSSLWAWGLGSDGALGLGGLESRDKPTQVSEGKWLAIAAGARFSAALNADGKPMVWGNLGFAASDSGGEDSIESIIERPVALEHWRDYRHETPLVAPGPAMPEKREASPLEEPPQPAKVPETSPVSEPVAKEVFKQAPVHPVPEESTSYSTSWIRIHPGWLLAGGGVVAVATALWVYLATDKEGGNTQPVDLGMPPGDPVAQEAR